MPNKKSAIVVLFVLFLLIAAYFGYTMFPNSNIKGATSIMAKNLKPGFGVEVASIQGTWDLNIYLCEEKDVCTAAVDSGYRWKTIGGGTTEGKGVVAEAADVWKNYNYVKVFVAPGTGSPVREFDLKLNTTSIAVEKLTFGEDYKYNALVFPVEQLFLDFYNLATFTDHP